MKKITFYTAADKRPDFIPLQHASLKKFVKDPYELVVLNNALDSKVRRNEISKICTELGIRMIEVKKDARFKTIGKDNVFTWLGSYKNANVGTAYPIKWAWQTMINENKDNLFAIIDSDMFFCRDISFNEELAEKDAACIIQYRGLNAGRKEAAVTYIWNAFCIFNPSMIPALSEMNWDCGIVKKAFINGFSVDVGGYIHEWLQKHPLHIKHISELALHRCEKIGDEKYHIKGTLNGNYYYGFDYDLKDKSTSHFQSYEEGWQQGDLVLPHLESGYEKILIGKTVKYFEAYIKDKQSYPNPTILGFIEFEHGTSDNKPFIIHNKAGSGYMGFDKEYGRLKLDFIKKTLAI